MARFVKESGSESMLTELSDLAPESRGIKHKRDVAFSMLSSPSSASESLSSNVLESVQVARL